jgi:5'-3' exonuclease
LPTTKYITFCRSIIRLFSDRGVSPRDMFMVFDNPCSVPLKIETNEARRQVRVLALEKAIAEERVKGITQEVMSLYRQAISITKLMTDSLHFECLEMGLCAVVAPTEADSTLAYLSLSNAVDYIVGEDSDFLVFGAKACIYKLVPSSGSCDVVRSEHLGRVFPRWTSERFLLFCILCGCDYLKISGVGPKTAFKVRNVNECCLHLLSLSTSSNANVTSSSASSDDVTSHT